MYIPFTYKAEVTRVVDGDTIDVELDLGFSILMRARVRLLGIDTPESRTRDKVEKVFGKAATAYAHTIIPEGSQCIVRTRRDRAGKYGRTLGDFVLAENRLYTDIMVENNHAVRYEGRSKDDIKEEHLRNREILVESGEVTI